MDVKIGEQLERYADFNFYIDYERWFVTFFRERDQENNPIPIKVSRGEESIFIWCFFLAIVQIVIDDDEDNPYNWVKYIYIDDPISSLDEHNAIKVAHDLIRMLSAARDNLRVVISTHHALFYNVIANQLRKKASVKFYLTKGEEIETYKLENWENVPPFHHLSTLFDLCKTRDSGQLNNHHFNMLRRVLEQTAAFFGYDSWVDCLKPLEGETEKAFQKRILDLSSHGDFVIFESPMITDSMRSDFYKILEEFRRSLPFNPAWFYAASVPQQSQSQQEALTS
jgi:wobble nucleotide-excising tRNase